MEALQENLSELDIGNTVESVQKFLESQRDLFHGQIDQLQNIVVAQCKLTGANPLSQEMAAGALSIKIGKRPRDLLNPKAVKYMQSVFSVKDAITKRESREISALFGVTVTQVREFFASQRSRVRRLVRVSREKSIKSNACQELQDGVSTSTAPVTPNDPVPLNTVGPTSVEEAPSCSTQDEALLGIDDSEKHFVENIFNLMRKEENFSGQVKLMEWILQIQNSSVLNWFLTKGGVMILATWLSQAAIEEQTSVLFVILKVLCHLPLHKALPVHMSAILQSVNRLRFYKTSDISNRARVLLSRCSKIFARSQAMKKPNAMKSSSDIQKEMMLKQSISEIMGDESWQSKMDISEQILAPSYENSENFRNLEPPKAVKLLQASADDLSRKHGRGVSSPQTRERRKVLLVEQPGQKTAGRNQQVARAVSASQGRPMSADDIQKAKMRAHFMQSKHGKIGSSNGSNGEKTEGTSKPMANQASVSHQASKVHLRPPIEEHVKPVALPSKTSNQLVALVHPKPILEPKEPLWEKCKKVQIPWQIPPEVIMNSQWGVGIGEDSKEVEVQKNRLRREKETVYQTVQEIPPNPKNPWDVEMDYDDSLTPEIPVEQPPDAAAAVTDNNAGTTEFSPGQEYENRSMVTWAATTSQIGSAGASQAEPDLELLAVLLKNPELVFALTSGQGGNLSNEDTVRLLDMIKSGGNGLMGNLAQERVEVSLPSPTPSSNPGTSVWRPEVVNNPFSKQNSTGNMDASSYTSRGVVSNMAATATQHPQQTPLSQHGFHLASMHQQTRPEKRPLSITPPVYQNNPINPILHSPTPPTRDYPVVANHNMHNHSIENSSNVNPSTVSMSLHTLDRTTQASFSLPPLLQTASLHEPPSIMRPNRQVGNSGPTPDSWSGRQGLAQNPYLANPDNYSSGPVRPGQGGHWERDEYVGEDEFEHWSPESRRYYNNNNRYVENSSGGWNYSESRANFGLNDRPDDRSRPRNSSSGYQDHGRHGNRRWHDRGGRDHDDHRRR